MGDGGAIRAVRLGPGSSAIHVSLMRPQSGEQSDSPLACVYHIHGGGMALTSAFDMGWQAWGRMIAHHGVAVAMGTIHGGDNMVLPCSDLALATARDIAGFCQGRLASLPSTAA